MQFSMILFQDYLSRGRQHIKATNDWFFMADATDNLLISDTFIRWSVSFSWLANCRPSLCISSISRGFFTTIAGIALFLKLVPPSMPYVWFPGKSSGQPLRLRWTSTRWRFQQATWTVVSGSLWWCPRWTAIVSGDGLPYVSFWGYGGIMCGYTHVQ